MEFLRPPVIPRKSRLRVVKLIGLFKCTYILKIECSGNDQCNDQHMRLFILTLPMFRLLSSKAQACKDF